MGPNGEMLADFGQGDKPAARDGARGAGRPGRRRSSRGAGALTSRGSSGASSSATGAGASAAPWPRSGGCARGSPRSPGPTSSSVCSQPSVRPKRERSTFSSRGVRVLSTLFVCSRRREPDDRLHRRDDLLVLDEVAEVAVLLLADRASPGVIGSWAILRTLRTLSTGTSILVGDLFRGRLAPELLDAAAARCG